MIQELLRQSQWLKGSLIDHTPPNLAAALCLDGDTSSLTICRTCMLTGRWWRRQSEVPQGSGSSHPPQSHPSLVPPQDSSPNPWLQHDLRVLCSPQEAKDPVFVLGLVLANLFFIQISRHVHEAVTPEEQLMGPVFKRRWDVNWTPGSGRK